VPPRWAPPRCPARRAGPGGHRPPGPAARAGPGRERLCEPCPPCGGLGDGADVCLAPHRWGGSGTAHRAAPPQVRGAPGGSARRAASLPQQERLVPTWGRLASAAGLCTGAAQVADGGILHPGDVDRGQVPRAQQAGQLARVTTVRCAPSASLLGDPRWSPPSSTSLLWCESGRARTHRGSLQRHSPAVCCWMALSGGAGRSRLGACRERRGRYPQRGALAQQRRRPSTLDGPPCRWRACETVVWLTAACVCLLWQPVALADSKLTHG
jgi:hypothetical protein